MSVKNTKLPFITTTDCRMSTAGIQSIVPSGCCDGVVHRAGDQSIYPLTDGDPFFHVQAANKRKLFIWPLEEGAFQNLTSSFS